MNRAQRARLAHQENLVHPHRKDLPCDIPGGVAEQEGHDRRDLFRAHLLNFGHARLLRLGFGWNGTDQPAPGERRDAVGTNMKALHVERDRFRQPDDAELRGGVIGLAEIADQAGCRGEVDERAAFLLAEQPCRGVRDIERAHQVHLDDGLEGVDAHAMEDRVAQDPGIIDHAVELDKAVDRASDDLAGGNCFRHRFEIGNCRAAVLFDFLDHFFGGRGARSRAVGGDAGVVHHDLGAFHRAEQRDLPANAAPGAGDDDGFAVE